MSPRRRDLVAGIDLGGTNMQIGIVDASGTIVERDRRKTGAADGCDAVIDRIVDGVNRVAVACGVSAGELAAIGIAAPGAIDIPRGVVLEAPNLAWNHVPLRDILHERFGCPVIVDNDVNGAVWGEHRLGAGRGKADLLGAWIGTGVGGGLILSRAIHHGPLFTAGELGHTIVRPDGEPGLRTVEDYCSRTGMNRIIRRRLSDCPESTLITADNSDGTIGADELARACDAGDPLALDVVRDAAMLLGVAIANVVTLLAVDRVVVGGGVAEALGESFVDLIRTSFRENVFPTRSQQCEILMTVLEDDAGLLGAALLAQDEVDIEPIAGQRT